jgi:hypothetical protein
MRSGIECLKRNRKNSHQQPLPGSLGKTSRAKAGVNIPLSQLQKYNNNGVYYLSIAFMDIALKSSTVH